MEPALLCNSHQLYCHAYSVTRNISEVRILRSQAFFLFYDFKYTWIRNCTKTVRSNVTIINVHVWVTLLQTVANIRFMTKTNRLTIHHNYDNWLTVPYLRLPLLTPTRAVRGFLFSLPLLPLWRIVTNKKKKKKVQVFILCALAVTGWRHWYIDSKLHFLFSY